MSYITGASPSYGGYSSGWKPSGSDIYKKYRAREDVWIHDDNETQVCVAQNVYISLNSSVSANYTATWAADGHGSASYSAKSTFGDGKTFLGCGTQYFWYDKGHEPYTRGIYGKISSSTSKWKGEVSTASNSVYVTPKPSYEISFDANTGTYAPESQTKWYGETLAITDELPIKSGYKFAVWNTSQDGTGASYESGGEYMLNAPATLYAQWSPDNPPTGECSGMTIPTTRERAIKNFVPVSVNLSNIIPHTGRKITKVEFRLGSQTSVKTGTNKQPSFFEGNYTITPNASGVLGGSITITDNIGAFSTYSVGFVTVENPTWHRVVEFDELFPDINSRGTIIATIKAKNYDTNSYDIIRTTNVSPSGDDYDWSIELDLEEKYFPVNSRTLQNPTPDIMITYDHSGTSERAYRHAFFNTTRNANYSTGLSNTMFVSGVTNDTNYSSRVWWSYVNNPLYFPDTNYVEVGSNDTQIMGLTKVGDYLGVVKQSKTTDTAIYLLYATSFDDDTTFAVKQGIQGVGALGKYSFNILGDETLFLSPQGIMAIVPSEDNEHKVQNRSFFIDGKLLKEDNLDSSYSFVFDGKYWISVNDKCYVLDGNQKQSWGNDVTNRVFEGYYLENIPADCFMKYNDELWFSNQEYVCRFTDGYVDAYQNDQNNVPVKAEWSTVLDDDGTLSYYKTMQKKGAVVSLLPETLSPNGTKVFVKKDTDEPVEIEREFTTHEGIPNEVYINKKFKKYKRLQFILRNEEAEPFGVNSIVKQYTLGNFAKR